MLSLGDRCNLAFVTGGVFVAGFFYAGLGVVVFFIGGGVGEGVCFFFIFAEGERERDLPTDRQAGRQTEEKME